MSNFTPTGKAMIPKQLGVPIDHFQITTHLDGRCTAQMLYRGDVVWEKPLGKLFCGDKIRIGPVDGVIPVKVDLD